MVTMTRVGEGGISDAGKHTGYLWSGSDGSITPASVIGFFTRDTLRNQSLKPTRPKIPFTAHKPIDEKVGGREPQRAA